jgi:hypothetical protein
MSTQPTTSKPGLTPQQSIEALNAFAEGQKYGKFTVKSAQGLNTFIAAAKKHIPASLSQQFTAAAEKAQKRFADIVPASTAANQAATTQEVVVENTPVPPQQQVQTPDATKQPAKTDEATASSSAPVVKNADEQDQPSKCKTYLGTAGSVVAWPFKKLAQGAKAVVQYPKTLAGTALAGVKLAGQYCVPTLIKPAGTLWGAAEYAELSTVCKGISAIDGFLSFEALKGAFAAAGPYVLNPYVGTVVGVGVVGYVAYKGVNYCITKKPDAASKQQDAPVSPLVITKEQEQPKQPDKANVPSSTETVVQPKQEDQPLVPSTTATVVQPKQEDQPLVPSTTDTVVPKKSPKAAETTDGNVFTRFFRGKPKAPVALSQVDQQTKKKQ